MRKPILFAASLAAGMIAGGLGVSALHSADQAQARWQLVLEAHGQAYVMDYDLSLGDCFDALNARTGAGWSCEREG